MTIINTIAKPGRLWTAVAAAALCSTISAPALVIGSATSKPDGTFTYNYKVDNRLGGFDIALWSLDFPFPTPDWDQRDTFSGGDVFVPTTDWLAGPGTPVGGQSAQDFLSFFGLSDVHVGDLALGFSFTSRYVPGTTEYHEFSPEGDSSSGYTIGPVRMLGVPDGGCTFALMATAVAGLACINRLRNTSCPAST